MIFLTPIVNERGEIIGADLPEENRRSYGSQVDDILATNNLRSGNDDSGPVQSGSMSSDAKLFIILMVLVIGVYIFNPQLSEKGISNFTMGNGNPLSGAAYEQPELTIMSSEKNRATYNLSGVDEKNITISFSGNCWVRILQDDQLITEKTYKKGDNIKLGDARETYIRFGYTPAATLTVNDITLQGFAGNVSPFNVTITKK